MSASVAFRRIVVPTDFSVSAEGAWALAQQLARATPQRRPGSGRPRSSRIAPARRAQGLTVRIALRTGVPYREIVALAQEEDADLIIVATIGRGGINPWRRARC